MSHEPLTELTRDDLEELLDAKVDSFTLAPLTAPGENYGSTMLSVDVTLLPDRRKISLVAKLVSKIPHMRESFRFHETVRKEIYMYMRVRPEFHAIQKEHAVPEEVFLDVIPRCYGARTTRGGGIDQLVDESAAILLENLKVSGYRLADRLMGLDLEHLQYVVTRLAHFHATVVVIKLKKPDVFKDTVMKTTFEVKKEPPSFGDDFPGPIAILEVLSHLPVVKQHMDKLKEKMGKMHIPRDKREPLQAREPYATLVHNDFWTNNMMFAYGGGDGGSITGLKIFDFQDPIYGSPAIDFLILMYSSRTVDVTTEDCDRLMVKYHAEFTKWLEIFGCDAEAFTYDDFLKEIETEAPKIFLRAFMMLRISSLAESNAPDVSDKSKMFSMFKDNSGLGNIYFRKVENLVKEFVDRNWL